jgi:hypothetical protein
VTAVEETLILVGVFSAEALVAFALLMTRDDIRREFVGWARSILH